MLKEYITNLVQSSKLINDEKEEGNPYSIRNIHIKYVIININGQKYNYCLFLFICSSNIQ